MIYLHFLRLYRVLQITVFSINGSIMTSLHNAVLELKKLDLLACGQSPLHRLDARAKVLVTFVFIVSVVSFSRYELSALIPFFLFPVVMIARSGLPPRFVIEKIILVSPFIIAVGLFNPLLDRDIVVRFGSFGVSGGWLSFASIVTRTALAVCAAYVLVGITGFAAVCQGLERLGVPKVFVVQLHFLHRYIFVLAEEVGRVTQARELRSCGGKGLGARSFAPMVGHLLLRTWQRADRIHAAMLSRGFCGMFHAGSATGFGVSEICFVLLWSSLFVFMRLYNLTLLLGYYIERLIS